MKELVSFLALFLLSGVVAPKYLYASDFGPLFVGAVNIFLACIIIVLGIKASVNKASTKEKKVGSYFAGICVLMLVGVGVAVDEMAHMSRNDFLGMILVVVVPGVIFLLLPLIVGKK